MKPAVSGMPAIDISRIAKMVATTGLRLASPDHCERWVASPSPSRTRVTMPKAAIVAKP